ncbi:MAG: nuclear transport factor 2 family protein [Chloroflexota bacterium]|nr:nuclear transport factor 2 family protein [Chloroflexota bacterium]
MDIIDEQVEAYNARDLDRFIHCYAENVTIEDGAGNVMLDGHEAIRALYGTLFAHSPALHVRIANRIRAGDYVIDEEEITGFVLPGYPTDFRAAIVYRIADGKIAHVRLLM